MKTCVVTVFVVCFLALCHNAAGRIDVFGDDRFIDKFVPDEPVAPWIGITEYVLKEIRQVIEQGEQLTGNDDVIGYLDKVEERLRFCHKVVAPLQYESRSPLGREASRVMTGYIESAMKTVQNARNDVQNGVQHPREAVQDVITSLRAIRT